MSRVNADFIMSTELECLTCTPDRPEVAGPAVEALLRTLREIAPTLPGPSGIFNPYGRIYVDSGHVELSLIECQTPYLLALMVERQQRLVKRAVDRLRAGGINLLLANNNHSGVLRTGCPVWGAHENYMVEKHPKKLTDLIMAFLTTRLQGGAGGVECPSGDFLAGVRPTAMELMTGGSTTHSRAIHSTSREEHHMGRAPSRFRYHLILGDGHRSQFNLALQFGTTALALKAIIFDRKLKQPLSKLPISKTTDWVQRIKQLNVLQRPGEGLKVDPVVIETQRVYWEAARRYADSLDDVPAWIHETLQDWDDTLIAWERMDRPWLAARFDAFAKYEFYSAVLADAGVSWEELPQNMELFYELALLDHSYHDFCDDESVFALLEEDGLLAHRVGPLVEPGEEAEPFVPETATRARARARFIVEHAGQADYSMDWSRVYDRSGQRIATLDDPFATSYGDWHQPEPRAEQHARRRPSLEQLLRRAQEAAAGDVPF